MISPQLRKDIENREFWYHTIDLPDGITTPGLFDLRGLVNELPWPDVKGMRCLDVGTFDGFFAFELERRGAAEVVAVDVESAELYDWPANVRPGLVTPSALDRKFYAPKNGAGFELASQALESNAQWMPLSIYDLDPSVIGKFDVVVCSSLLLHLRDPIRALEAIRSVCAGQFMSFEPIDLPLTVLHRRKPVAKFDGLGDDCQWWTPNGAAQVRMLDSAGFSVTQIARPMVVPFYKHDFPRKTVRQRATLALNRALTKSAHPGVPQRALTARPTI